MKTSKEFLYYSYQEIENYILNHNLEGAKSRFDEQIKNLSDIEQKLEYIDYIKRQEMSFYNNGLSQLKIYIKSIESIFNLPIPPPTQPLHFTRLTKPEEEELECVYTGLTADGFLPTDSTGADYKAFCYIFGNGKVDDFKPLMWIKSNSTTHDKILNKKSLLDLLSLLKIPYKEITDKSLLNKLFINPDGTSIKFTASNYTNTQTNFNSEYHIQLLKIVDNK